MKEFLTTAFQELVGLKAFGMATTRFWIFRWPIIATDKKVILISKAVVTLHNFLMSLSISERNHSYKYCQQVMLIRKIHLVQLQMSGGTMLV